MIYSTSGQDHLTEELRKRVMKHGAVWFRGVLAACGSKTLKDMSHSGIVEALIQSDVLQEAELRIKEKVPAQVKTVTDFDLPAGAPVIPPLTEEQEQGMEVIDKFIKDDEAGQYLSVQGLAGTGKTVLLATAARKYSSLLLGTPTGKAADVLRKKTGMPVNTLHSIFYSLTEIRKRADGTEDMQFKRVHDDGDLWGRYVGVDESSMINEEIGGDMMRTGARFVTFGDPGQLPPVKGEQFFSKPHFSLKTIHRQALDSPIIRQAHRVRLGQGYDNDGPAFKVQPKLAPEQLLEADILLCWKNVTRQALNGLARRHRGIVKPFPQAGEPVLCLKNAPEYGIFNGGVYTLIRPFEDGDTDIYLRVDGQEEKVPFVKFEACRNAVPSWEEVTTSFALGYALTVHKSQGSEWNKVVLVDEYTMRDDRVRWLYTGITRAAQQIIIIRR